MILGGSVLKAPSRFKFNILLTKNLYSINTFWLLFNS